MSDYISKSALIEVLENECKGQLIGDENVTLISFGDVIDLVFEQPTLDEKEIIRKAFERVVERLELLKYRHIPSRTETIEKAIEILKEECGISE